LRAAPRTIAEMSDNARTALSQAQERFLEGLEARAAELRGSLSLVVASPGDERVHVELRRRLHALYASSQVAVEMALADRLRRALQIVDDAGGAGRPLSQSDLDEVAKIIGELPSYAIPETSASKSDPPASLLVAARLSIPPQPSEQPVEVHQTSAGFLPAPAAIAVLVIDNEQVLQEVRAALPEDTFEVAGSAEPDLAVRLMHSLAPDVVLIDDVLARQPGLELVRRLRTDPLADVKHLLLLTADPRDPLGQAARAGADGAVPKPIDAAALRRRIEELAALQSIERSGLEGLASATVSDIADRFADEIRRGIADSLQVGHGEQVPIDEGTELMAAAWSAIGRVRAHLAERSQGRVRFHDAPRTGGPAALALTEGGGGDASSMTGDVLAGRRILVADDDPAVVWFFAGVMREAGATVIEAKDGTEALELSRLRRPDVVVSDILMPGVDGFALCRELKRDLILSEVPVVLLSWKEDFLQRMRELESGARGYLRKEAGSGQILASVVEVLRPRARLEAQLEGDGEVRGQVEGVGILVLLETVAKRRPNVHLTVRDAWNYFEVDLRDGSQLAISRTASDGTFGRGKDALNQLLGVNAGRFSVVTDRSAVRGTFDEPMDLLLQDAARRLGALLDAVSDNQLLEVAHVEFDDAIIPSLSNATPTAVMSVVERLRTIDSGESVVMQAGIAPHELERSLRELARRGAVRDVYDVDGNDLVIDAMRLRQERPGTLFHSSLPPRPEPRRSSRPSSIPPVADESMPPMRGAAPPDEDGGEDSGEDWFDHPERPPVITSLVPPPMTSPENIDGETDEQARRSIRGTVAKVLLLLAMGFVAATSLFNAGLMKPRSPGDASAERGRPAGAPSAPAAATPTAPVDELKKLPPLPDARAALTPLPLKRPGDASVGDIGFGRLLPFIDHSRGIEVPAGQGLLVVEGRAGEPTPYRIRVGDRELGATPVGVALPEGRYEVVFRRGEESSFRYLLIRGGETRIVDAP